MGVKTRPEFYIDQYGRAPPLRSFGWPAKSFGQQSSDSNEYRLAQILSEFYARPGPPNQKQLSYFLSRTPALDSSKFRNEGTAAQRGCPNSAQTRNLCS